MQPVKVLNSSFRFGRRGSCATWIVAALLACFITTPVFAADIPPPPQDQPFWFPVGEELTYRISWGWIPVGVTKVTTQWQWDGTRYMLVIRYRTKTNAFVQKLYPVDDTIEAVIDPDTFHTSRFYKKLNRGNDRCEEEVLFDYATLNADWKSHCSGETRRISITTHTRDLVSFMYSARSDTFVPNTNYLYDILADGKHWSIRVKTRDIETVNLPGYGKTECIRLQPEAGFQGIFGLSGDIEMWVSTDDRSICTLIKGDVPVASIKAKLCRVSGPGDDEWTRWQDDGQKAECDIPRDETNSETP